MIKTKLTDPSNFINECIMSNGWNGRDSCGTVLELKLQYLAIQGTWCPSDFILNLTNHVFF